MKSKLIHIKTDTATKNQAQKVAQDLGFALSTLINAYLKQLIKNRVVHFTVDKQVVTVQDRILTLSEIKRKTLPVLRARKVKRASIFGSYARGEARPDSDVDILVELPKGLSLWDVIGIKRELAEALHKDVDLIEYGHIRPELKDRILSEQTQIL